MAWNWVDIILLLLVLSAVIGGYRRGLTQIVGSWLGLITGFLAAVLFFKPLKLQLLAWVGVNQTVAGGLAKPVSTVILSSLMTVVAFALILIAFNILFKLLGRAVHGLMETIGLSWVDGGLGAAITLVLAMVMVALVIGMGKPLLQMGLTADWSWALVVNREMQTSQLQPIFWQLYQSWGSWVKPHI